MPQSPRASVPLLVLVVAHSSACTLAPSDRNSKRSSSARAEEEAPTKNAAGTRAEREAPPSPKSPVGAGGPGAPARQPTTTGPTPSPAGGPPGTAQKLDGVRIVEGKSGVTEAGFVQISGTVINDTDKWLDSAWVDVVLLDAVGTPITVDSIGAAAGEGERALVERRFVPAHSFGYFMYLRDAQKLARPYGAHKLHVQGFLGDGRTRPEASGISVVKDEDGHYNVTATVTNPGDGPCNSPDLVWGKFDSGGTLLEVGQVLVDDWFQKDLTAGGTAHVKGKVYDFDKVVSELRFYADCQYVSSH